MKIKIFRKKNKNIKIVVTLKDLEPSMIEVLENRVTEKIANKIVEEKYDEVSKKVSTELPIGNTSSPRGNVCPKCGSGANVILIGGSDLGGESFCRSCNSRWFWP